MRALRAYSRPIRAYYCRPRGHVRQVHSPGMVGGNAKGDWGGGGGTNNHSNPCSCAFRSCIVLVFFFYVLYCIVLCRVDAIFFVIVTFERMVSTLETTGWMEAKTMWDIRSISELTLSTNKKFSDRSLFDGLFYFVRAKSFNTEGSLAAVLFFILLSRVSGNHSPFFFCLLVSCCVREKLSLTWWRFILITTRC